MNQPSNQLGLTVRPEDVRPVRPDTETAQVGRTTHSAIYSRGVTSDLQAAVSGTTSDLSDLLDTLGEIKERIDAGVTYCRKHRNNDRLYSKGHARLTRILARDYLPTLDALKTAYPIEQLETERETIIGRLEKGWQLADSESRARTFAKLLARYEVLTDAIDGDVLARHLGRAA